jgi:hypothetical protein
MYPALCAPLSPSAARAGSRSRRGTAPRKRLARMLLAAGCILAVCCPVAAAGNAEPEGLLFKDREIHLELPLNAQVTFGVTGTTAGRRFIALATEARQQPIDLSALGYWEKVADPPSSLRNHDLQVMVHNRFNGRFKIELAYDPGHRQIRYRVVGGDVLVQVDGGSYVPLLTVVPKAEHGAVSPATQPTSGRRLVFFDFNSFDGDLKQYYGKIKRLMQNRTVAPYFFCYEAAGYDSYFFRIYSDPGRLDTAKMGLSLENGSLGYYQKALENLKAHKGEALSGRITLVSRFGHDHAIALNQFARDIGIAVDGDIRFRSYSELE